MLVEMRPIGSIRPYENNPRVNDEAVAAVAGRRRPGIGRGVSATSAGAVERAVPIDGKDAGALAGEPPANQKHTLGSTVLWCSELPPLLLSTMATLVVL